MTSFASRVSRALGHAGGEPVAKLALSMLASMTGSNLILIALSVHFFTGTGSAVVAAGVYVAQFLPVVVLMPVAWRICDRLPIRNSLVGLEIASAMTTCLVGLAVTFDLVALVYSLLFVRGFFDMTTKAARTVAVKTLAPPETVAQANNLVSAANYIGQCLGALLGFALIAKMPMMGIAFIDAVTFMVSAAICIRLTHRPAINASKGGYRSMLVRAKRALGSDRALLRGVLYLVGCVIFLQGFNQVARLWIPLAWLGLPPSAGAISEAIGIVGIVLGLGFVSRFLSGPTAWPWPLHAITVAALISMLLPFATHNIVGSFAFYFVYMFMFEITFMVSMNTILNRGKQEDIPCIMVMFYGLAFGGMTVSSLSIGAVADYCELPITSLCVFLIAAALVWCVETKLKRPSEGE